MASESLLKSSLIQYLSVQDLNLLSDHKPARLKISNNNLLQTNKNSTNCILEDRPSKYHWDNSLKKSYEEHLADKSNHFVRHYDVSCDCRRNINSLIEDIVSSDQNVYIHTTDKVLKKVRKCKTNKKVHKNKQLFNKEWLIKWKELRLIKRL